jgi:hypothetical protein
LGLRGVAAAAPCLIVKQLEGPWSAPVRIAVPELAGKKTSLVYCTFLHPELGGVDAGRVVVTFCRSLKGNWELSNPEWVVMEVGR